eukprot:10845004-Karenia_brevis.AAC.1
MVVDAITEHMSLVPEGEWELLEQTGMSKFWTVAVKGSNSLAGRRVRKVLSSLKQDDGQWKKVWAETPKGKVQVFMGPDKSKKTVQTEMATKKMVDILCKAKPDLAKSFTSHKAQGIIFHDWEDLALVEVEDAKSPPRVAWQKEFAKTLGLDTDELAEKFSAACQRRKPRKEMWCS